MTRVLAAAVVAAQLLDLATWMAMPRAAEVNPIAIGLHTQSAWLAKGALVLLVLGIQPALRPKYSAVGELVAVVAIAAGCVGAGSNLAVLTYVAAAEAPRPATQPAPVSIGTTGNEQGTQAPAAEPRTPAPTVRRQPELVPMGHETKGAHPGASPATFHGRASWYGAAGLVAAAGPALRRALGRHWRGATVTACSLHRCVRVRLVDWCQCYRGTPRERAIDLSPEAFARLAPLERGVLRIRIVPRGTA